MHDPYLGVAIESMRPAESKHLLATGVCRASTKANGGFRLSGGSFASENGSARLQGPADRLSISIGEMTFGMSPPNQASGFIQGGVGARAGGGRQELFREHRFSVRGQGPAEGRARFQAKLRQCLKMGLASVLIFGEYRVA
jgi:hypothetical protein